MDVRQYYACYSNTHPTVSVPRRIKLHIRMMMDGHFMGVVLQCTAYYMMIENDYFSLLAFHICLAWLNLISCFLDSLQKHYRKVFSDGKYTFLSVGWINTNRRLTYLHYSASEISNTPKNSGCFDKL